MFKLVHSLYRKYVSCGDSHKRELLEISRAKYFHNEVNTR